jgi:hypothetical protein
MSPLVFTAPRCRLNYAMHGENERSPRWRLNRTRRNLFAYENRFHTRDKAGLPPLVLSPGKITEGGKQAWGRFLAASEGSCGAV